MNLPTMPLLSRVQPLPVTYGTHNVTNNMAELLTRIMACELLPKNTPVIVIYDSTIVHIQHIALLGHSYTNRQRTRSVFPATSRILAHRLEATSSRLPIGIPRHDNTPYRLRDDTPILIDSILAQIHKLNPCGKTWIPHKHLYIKIKSHHLCSNYHPKYHASPSHTLPWSTVITGQIKRATCHVSTPCGTCSPYAAP